MSSTAALSFFLSQKLVLNQYRGSLSDNYLNGNWERFWKLCWVFARMGDSIETPLCFVLLSFVCSLCVLGSRSALTSKIYIVAISLYICFYSTAPSHCLRELRQLGRLFEPAKRSCSGPTRGAIDAHDTAAHVAAQVLGHCKYQFVRQGSAGGICGGVMNIYDNRRW